MKRIKTYQVFLESAEGISGTKTFTDLQNDLKVYNAFKNKVKTNVSSNKNPGDGIKEYEKNSLLKNYGLIQKYKKETVELINTIKGMDDKIVGYRADLSDPANKDNNDLKKSINDSIKDINDKTSEYRDKYNKLNIKIKKLSELNNKIVLLSNKKDIKPEDFSNSIIKIQQELKKISI